MVSTASTYDFTAIIDGFFSRKKIRGPHAALITASVRDRARTLLSHDDVRYMPAFKILDMLAALVNIATAIMDAPQQRPNEVKALLRESFSDGTPLIRQFMLEAALERARYEPLMIATPANESTAERDVILHRRWAAMRAAHQEKAQLPDDWMDAVDTAVEHAMTAKAFQHFRQGPLLQLLAEMLAIARKFHHQRETLDALETAISDGGALWRRYALKTARFSEKAAKASDIKSIQPPHTIH
jgi:hypothetical protein